MAAQVVNFFLLLFILKKLLYKPLLKVLAQRKKRIEDSLKNAEEIEKKLQQTNEEVEKTLAKALEDGQKIIDESKQLSNRIIEDSQKTATEIINNAYKQADEVKRSEYVKLEQEVKEHAANLVALVFEKVTGKRVTSREQKRLIEKEVQNLS